MTTPAAYKVIAKRWEHGFELHIDGVGVTQVEDLGDAEATARDYIALDLGVAADSIEITTETTRPTSVDPKPIGGASAGSQTPAPTKGDATASGLSSGRGQTSPAAMPEPSPTGPSPQGTPTSRPTKLSPSPIPVASAGTTTSPQASRAATPIEDPPAGTAFQLIDDAVEADPAFLALAADLVDDLERVRIANENRLRHLTRAQTDSDGEVRGLGLDARHPYVRRFSHVVNAMKVAEHEAVLGLQSLMRKHPLGPWVKATVGVGEKQAARLLAVIGDPHIRPELVREDGTVEPSRPRTVSELWAYAGYHVTNFPADQVVCDAQRPAVGGEQTGHPDQSPTGTHACCVGVAPKRQKGQRANWSTLAKTRTYLIAESCIKQRSSPFRAVYDDTRAKYADATHATPCARCGPAGKPAPTGSPLSDGHKHARALRAVSKAVLKELWREARRLHEGAAS